VNFLLDTNVVSEWTKPNPNIGVVKWLAEADEDRMFLSAITFGELQYGMARLQAGAKRKRLEEWVEAELKERFAGRVIGIDEEIASFWGGLLARAESQGRPMGTMDGFLGATALVKGMTLVTRNERDFAASGIETFNPWSD
jgi:predicted nucleic acid-binding protein